LLRKSILGLMIVVGVAGIGGLFINPLRSFLRKSSYQAEKRQISACWRCYIGNLVWVPFGTYSC